jgi:hypothetical protein
VVGQDPGSIQRSLQSLGGRGGGGDARIDI